MNRIVSIGTALLILFQGINLQFNDLVELDALVEHYQFHVESHGDDFMSFLSKHYGSERDSHNLAHKEEQKQHEQLPFQNQGQSYQPLVLLFGQTPPLLTRSEDPREPNGMFLYLNTYSPLLGDGPFQPPKNT